MLVGTMRAGAFDPTLALTNAESLTRAIDVYKLFDEDDAWLPRPQSLSNFGRWRAYTLEGTRLFGSGTLVRAYRS
jgi:hypothetical protein